MKDFFFSYCWADAKIARFLANHLIKNRISIWIDDREMNAGDSIPKEIRAALDASHTVLLMWSKNSSVARWTRDEVTAAISLGKRIIPCCLDNTPLPKQLKASHIIYLNLQSLHEKTAVQKLLEIVQKPYKPRSVKRPQIDNIPYLRNPNFTGRKEQFKAIENSLNKVSNFTVTAIVGLGGIGKTELVIEYIFRYSCNYNLIWWLRSEGMITLSIDYENLAHELNLPEKNEPNQKIIIQAVKRWLENNDGWLLIFDNAMELNKIRAYLPQKIRGHILITSRNPAWSGVANVIELKEWARPESIQFLLKRARQNNGADANKVANVMGDLPLALEQASAYIEAKQMTFASYEKLFLKERKALLNRGETSTEYSDIVATTWEISFRELKRNSEISVTFLNLCAFLASDPIPLDEVFENTKRVPLKLKGAFANKVDFKDMYSPLIYYSLVRIDDDHLSIHPLVQAVIQDNMSKQEQQLSAEAALALVTDLFPEDSGEVCYWSQCQIWLSHAYKTTSYAEHHKIEWSEIGSLYNRMGIYLHGRAVYSEAETLFRHALKIDDVILGARHPNFATLLNNLAVVLKDKGRYSEAKVLLYRAMKIKDLQKNKENSDLTTELNNLGVLLMDLGRYPEAEALLRRALKIRETRFGSKHPKVATSLNDLALILRAQGKYPEAESLLRRALKIRKTQVGNKHPYTATTLNNLANVFRDQCKYIEAEHLVRHSLNILEVWLGIEHPKVATVLNNLAILLKDQGNYPEAEKLVRRSLKITISHLGNDHPYVVSGLATLAILIMDQGKYTKAEHLFRHSLKLIESQLGNEHPDLAIGQYHLAVLLSDQGKYVEAEELARRALEIIEAQLDSQHPDVAANLHNLARILDHRGKYAEAEQLFRRALKIRESVFGSQHLDVALSLNTLATTLRNIKKYSEAELLYHRALKIRENKLGQDHPFVANTLNNLGVLFEAQGMFSEAKSAYIRGLKIRETQFGKAHPNVAYSLTNLAELLRKEGKYSDSKSLLTRALKIRTARLGKDHPLTKTTYDKLKIIISEIK